MNKALIALAILGMSFSQVSADYTVKGSVQCPDVVTEDANENYREFNKWWLLGYFSARNYVSDIMNSENGTQLNSEVGKGIESDNIYAMALEFCKANSEKDWDDAAIHVYNLLD